MYRLFFSFLVALCMYMRCAVAASTPHEIANSLNELAQQGFAAKNLVLEINSTADAGPIPDVYTEMDTMVAVVLTDVKFMTNTPTITDQTQQQDVYEGYSNAYFYNIIGLFPGNSSYNAQANNQKAQVDTHCFQAVWAFDRGNSNGSQASYQARSGSSLHGRWMKRDTSGN
ncbi:hypothetical protein PoHVEF18_003796 [Penicillium ochrochloron]